MEKYLNYVCPKCYNTLDNCKCAYDKMPYYLTMIDRNIQEHIRILNSKKYITFACCESHYHEFCASIYIAFGNDYEFDKISTIPDGFIYNKRHRTITYKFKRNISKEEFQSIKENKLNELLEWCKKLPDRE